MGMLRVRSGGQQDKPVGNWESIGGAANGEAPVLRGLRTNPTRDSTAAKEYAGYALG